MHRPPRTTRLLLTLGFVALAALGCDDDDPTARDVVGIDTSESDGTSATTAPDALDASIDGFDSTAPTDATTDDATGDTIAPSDTATPGDVDGGDDTSATCGNAVLETGETCDSGDLGTATCTSEGFAGGTLLCAADCLSFDTSNCSGQAAAPPAGAVIFSELMIDPVTLAAPDGQWVEIFNPTGDAYALDGCTLESEGMGMMSESFGIASATIGAGARLTIAASSDAALGFVPDVVWTGIALASRDAVRLDCAGTLIDEVVWTNQWTIPTGASLSLDPSASDAAANDLPENWCATPTRPPGDPATPGAENPACGSTSVGWRIGFCRTQFPETLDIPEGTVTTFYGRVYAAGLTDQTTGVDADANLVAEIGYGPDGENPSVDATNWVFATAMPNAGWVDDMGPSPEPNNDEYQGDFAAPAAGAWDFAYRFSGDGGATWVYCDTGSGYALDAMGNLISDYAPAEAGQMTTSSP